MKAAGMKCEMPQRQKVFGVDEEPPPPPGSSSAPLSRGGGPAGESRRCLFHFGCILCKECVQRVFSSPLEGTTGAESSQTEGGVLPN